MQHQVDLQGLELAEGERPFVIEGSFFQMNSVTGIARVWKQIIGEWQKSGFAQQVIFLDRNRTMPAFEGIRKLVIPSHDYGDLDKDPSLLQRYCDALNAAAFCSTYYAYPETTPALAVIHDMIPELLAYDLTEPMWAEKQKFLQRADYFVCVSENTKKDLLSLRPAVASRPVHVGLNGVSPLYDETQKSTETLASGFDIHNEYVLFVGGDAPYKGLMTLLKALSETPETERPLLVVVSGYPHVEALCAEYLGVQGVRAFHATDEGLRILYEGALAYVCPSFYEGFGLTLLEAMSCGCPVISSNGGSLPEVAGDAAWLFPAGDVEKLAEAIQHLRDVHIRNQLIMRGYRRIEDFSWSDIANAVQDGLLYLAENGRKSLAG